MGKLVIKNKYGVTPNEILNNPKLSLKAKGLFGYIQSKPEKWQFSTTRIAKQSKEGKEAVKTALKELENNGYLERKAVKDKEGKWAGYDYILSEKPLTVKPLAKNQPAGNTPTLSKKDNSKKDIVKKNNIYIPSVNSTNQVNNTGKKKKPSKEEVASYFEDNGYKSDVAIKAWNYYDVNDWKDANGKKVKNWKQKMIGVWFKPENKKGNKDYSSMSDFDLMEEKLKMQKDREAGKPIGDVNALLKELNKRFSF